MHSEQSANIRILGSVHLGRVHKWHAPRSNALRADLHVTLPAEHVAQRLQGEVVGIHRDEQPVNGACGWWEGRGHKRSAVES